MADDIRFSQPAYQGEGTRGFFQAPRPFTSEEFDRMIGLGLFETQERVEIRGGLIYEGESRHCFTRAEFDALIADGMFPERERVELIGGEIVSMMGEGDAHVDGVELLAEALSAIVPSGLTVRSRTRLDLPDGSEVYPDILVCEKGLRIKDMNPANIHLVVETSDSTFDRDVKAPRYAAAGLEEYWIFHVIPRTLWVYRDPHEGTWRSIAKVEGDERASPLFAPNATVSLPRLEELLSND